MQTRIKSDTVSSDLAARIKRAENGADIMEAVGLQVVSWAQGAFRDTSKRPIPWPARKKGSNPLLKKSGALHQSIRVASVTNDSVVVGTDRPYAAYHQLGTKHLPKRPFMPFDNSGKMMPEAQARVMKIILKKLEGQA